MTNKKYGNLYLLPATMGDTDIQKVLPAYNLEIFQQITHFIVEELRTARRFLRKAGYHKNFDTEVNFQVLNEHTQAEEYSALLQAALAGKDMGLLSEAGVPCVADPGNVAVRMAHEKGIRVIPLVGPSSILMALMASGLNGQNFAFNGYLPIKPHEKNRKIRELEQKALSTGQTQCFIETPYRNIKLYESLISQCSPHTQLCIACNITLENEWIQTHSIKQWKGINPPIHKQTTVFLLGQ